MPWDITTPANDEPIRKLGEIGRDHWLAIQNADTDVAPFLNYCSLQMANRTALGVAVDPTPAASTFYIYSKNDVAPAAGKQELFLRDPITPTPHTIQLTNDGKIGSTATDFEADSISFDGTVTYNENNMIRAWGLVAASSGFLLNRGFVSVTSGGTGIHNFDITGLGPLGASFASADSYGVIATAAYTSRSHIASVTNKTATTFTVRTKNDLGDSAAVQFSVILLG